MLPFINMNGTIREALIEGRLDVLNKLQDAIDSLQNIAPHGRDAFDKEHWCKMSDVFNRRLETLNNLKNELETEAFALSDGEGFSVPK